MRLRMWDRIIPIRMSDSMWNDLQIEAAKQDRSAASLIRDILYRWLKYAAKKDVSKISKEAMNKLEKLGSEIPAKPPERSAS